jgi:hypothetical protein
MSKVLGMALFGYPREVGAVPLPLNEWPRTDPDCEFWWSQRGLSAGDVGNPLDTMLDWSTNVRDAPAASAAWNAILTSDHRASVISIGARRALQFLATAQAGPFPNDNTGQGYVIASIPMGSPMAFVAIFRPNNSGVVNGLLHELGGNSQTPPGDNQDGKTRYMAGGERILKWVTPATQYVEGYAEWGNSGVIDVRYTEDNAGGTGIDSYDRAQSALALTPSFTFGAYGNPVSAFVPTTSTIGFRSHPTNTDYSYTDGDLLEFMVFSNRGKLAQLNTYLSTYYADLIV